MQNVLIIGGKGNLGNQISKLIPNALCWDRDELDITDELAVQQTLESLEDVQVIINCAAYNDLDSAEDHPELAFTLNESAPKYLAQAAKNKNAVFVHFSTGYIFSGSQKEIHSETDLPDPNSVYAQSKLAGEKAVEQVGGKYYILRTNLLFGPQGPSQSAKKSVVDTMKDMGISKKHLRGIIDEQSNFTYTPDLAAATVNVLHTQPTFGIYHLVNEGYGSWYDLARQIFTTLGWIIYDEPRVEMPDYAIIIEKITGADYPRKAKRPISAVLINTKLPKIRPWQEALKEYLANETH